MRLINETLLDEVTQQAKESPRLRMNHNLHDSLDAKAQRLLNALEPGTVLPIHRHRHTAETYVLLRGKIKVMYYNDRKEETEQVVLDPKRETMEYTFRRDSGIRWRYWKVERSF